MVRCVRLWTGEDRNSHFEEGVIDLAPGVRGDRHRTRGRCGSIAGGATRRIAGRLDRGVRRHRRPAKCFAGELTPQAWLPKLKEMIPSYDISLIDDAAFTRRIRSETARALKLEDVNAARASAQGRSAGVR
jgi:hypothetical protein